MNKLKKIGLIFILPFIISFLCFVVFLFMYIATRNIGAFIYITMVVMFSAGIVILLISE